MKVPPTQADRFAQAPDPSIRAVLVYGPDAGLVRERAQALTCSVVADPQDPFLVAQLTGAQLTGDPARLADEAAALALTGGRRVVRVENAADEVSGLLSGFLAEPPGDALVVVQAGDLPARSSLRKTFEKAELGAALPCYRDDQRGLEAVIVNTLRQEGLTIATDALAFLAANLGGDRQLTRRELEKLVLYMGGPGAQGDKQVSLGDVRSCIGDSAELTMDDLAFAVAGGDLAAVDRAFNRFLEEGSHPVAALRAVARHFQRLHLVAGAVSAGASRDEAARRLRPPLFWKNAERFKAQSAAWPVPGLARALSNLLEAEAACKQSGAPAEALAARALVTIAANAPQRRRRAG